jgi:hypothetical protein
MPLRRKRKQAAEDAPATMTTTEVMWFLGYGSTKAASTWLRRYNVQAQSRHPGSHGENVYLRADVEHAKEHMIGRGYGGGKPAHKPKPRTEGT